MKRKSKGFTLVELVITIAIVIILSAVSVPIYEGYMKKAKMSEGYALLGLILSAQKAYYSEYGNFLSVHADENKYTCNDLVLGVDARGNKYFTWFRFGHTSSFVPYQFHASVKKPEEFISKEGYSYLRLAYDITVGPIFYDDVSS